MLVELNEQDTNELLQLVDIAVKGAGLQAAPLATNILNKIQAAQNRENATSTKKTAKKATKDKGE